MEKQYGEKYFLKKKKLFFQLLQVGTTSLVWLLVGLPMMEPIPEPQPLRNCFDTLP